VVCGFKVDMVVAVVVVAVVGRGFTLELELRIAEES
jgi:hypothetical protein